MHSRRKKSCANLALDDTIKHLQSESKKKEVRTARQRDSPRYALYSYERNLFHLVHFDDDYNESLQSNFRVVAIPETVDCVERKKNEKNVAAKNGCKKQLTLISVPSLSFSVFLGGRDFLNSVAKTRKMFFKRITRDSFSRTIANTRIDIPCNRVISFIKRRTAHHLCN